MLSPLWASILCLVSHTPPRRSPAPQCLWGAVPLWGTCVRVSRHTVGEESAAATRRRVGEKVESPSTGESQGSPVPHGGNQWRGRERPRHRPLGKSAHVHFNCTKRSPAEGPGSCMRCRRRLGAAWGGHALRVQRA